MHKLLALASFLVFVQSHAFGVCLIDVEKSFREVNEKVVPLAFWTDGQMVGHSYSQSLLNKYGLNTHIQGIVRVPGTSRFILSGGDIKSQVGSLFEVELGSQSHRSTLEANFHRSTKQTSLQDKIIQRTDVTHGKYWHVGGLGLFENILAVPTENGLDKKSTILFYDVSGSEWQLLPVQIHREHDKTGSMMIFRNKDNRIVVGANDNGHSTIEFYVSKTSDIRDGFEEKSTKLAFAANGQGNDVIEQCDGKKYIIDFNNTSFVPPIIWGKDFVRLFSFDEKSYELNLVATRFLDTKRNCNFKAAGSHYITETGKLVLYGSHFYRHAGGKRFKMCQFSE